MMRFYTAYEEKWKTAVENAQILDTELQAPEYKNAILLPLRKRTDTPNSSFDGWHEGGVCSEDYSFLAGLDRKLPRKASNYSCVKSYIPESTTYRDETVVFGGVLIHHFGHNLVDNLSRMWYFARHPDTPYKFVFLMMTNQTGFFKAFFELAGLEETRYEIITEATQFRNVIIPDQAFYSLSSIAHPDWLLFFERIKENVNKICPASNIEKVYLTRTQLPAETGFEANERFFEAFFSEQGYTVIAPEKLSLVQQINIIMNASSVATTIGTLSHMMIFANIDTNCTFLLRTPSEVIRPQIIIDLLRGYTCSYVEATKEILPSPHSRGVPMYWQTVYFESYLIDNNVHATKSFSYAEEFPVVMDEYIKKYALNYRDPEAFQRIANYTAFDFVNALNYALYGVKLDKKNYQESKLEIKNKKLEAELRGLKNSTSWKVTKPLRMVFDALRTFKKKLKNYL